MPALIYSELSVTVDGTPVSVEIDGVESLLARRPLPIPRVSREFLSVVLSRPMTATQVSQMLYGDASAWGLIVEWNALAQPVGRWLTEYIPGGFKVLYLPIAVYQALHRGSRVPTLRGQGETQGSGGGA